MKKHFSRIIIPFFIVAILFGVFGVGEVNAQSYQDVTNPTGGLTVPAATTPSVGPTINSATNAQMIVLCQQQFAGDLTKINDCIARNKGRKRISHMGRSYRRLAGSRKWDHDFS